MDLVLRDYEHYARKTIAVYETALAYRKTYRETPFSTKAHRAVLLEGTKQLKSLRSDFPASKKDIDVRYARAAEIPPISRA